MNELLPGIYAKQIFDRIHKQNGMDYEWTNLSDDNVLFDKLILPYSGDKKKLNEQFITLNEVNADMSNSYASSKHNLGNGVSNGYIPKFEPDIDNEIKDIKNHYNDTLSRYINDYVVDGNNALIYKVKINYSLNLHNPNSYDISLRSAIQRRSEEHTS